MGRMTIHAMNTAARAGMARLARDRSGNTLPMIAAAIAPLLAMIGGGIDMGRSYLTETRLQQACDAGVLAARKKLGSTIAADGNVPAEVAIVGNRFFNVNFRPGAYGSTNRNFQMTLEDDYSVSGVASADVPTSIMRIFGYSQVPVEVDCQASLNFSNTDVMLVLDVTGSMNQKAHPTDPLNKIDSLKNTVRSFYNTVQASAAPGVRIRYGFVPYSTNVRVGQLLEDDWVVDEWTYQSREAHSTSTNTTTRVTWENFHYLDGGYNQTIVSTYSPTYHNAGFESGTGYYSCDTAPPNDTYNASYNRESLVDEAYEGPPAGTRRIEHYTRVANGYDYWVNFNGVTCEVTRAEYTGYTDEYDQITTPVYAGQTDWRYAPITRDVSNWRTQTAGCIEERSTYEIDDYDNVDFTRALDLDIDTVPTAGDPDTQWRPQYPGIIYARSLNSVNSNNFTVDPVISNNDFFMPNWEIGLVACPAAARKLAPIASLAALNTYLDTLQAGGATYHDIGMIWGARLLSPTGLFAAENADVDGRPTSRHMIFLTDGETAPHDVAYGAYGLEPLDQRRWRSQALSGSLTSVVENRFKVACAEARKRNITVWVISFGLHMNDIMTECAGSDHAFEADTASELNEAFDKIAKAMGDLRISR